MNNSETYTISSAQGAPRLVSALTSASLEGTLGTDYGPKCFKHDQ